MNAKVFSGKTLIGKTILYLRDPSMGCVYGEFKPLSAYSIIQKRIWQCWTKGDFSEMFALRLNIQLENGYFLFPLGGIMIEDSPELPDEPIYIEAAGLFSHATGDYFNRNPPAPFLQEPWAALTITDKLKFEDELYQELLRNRFQAKHTLSDFSYSALCRDQRNNNVLFAIHKPGKNNSFAMVKLTWKTKEKNPFPLTNYFKDFDEFKYLQMYPDKNDRGIDPFDNGRRS